MGMIFLVVFITVLIGLVTGWLVNYLSDVLPVTRTFSRPTCPECQKPYKWVTYLSLRRCEQCDNKRSIRTWLVFLLFPVASVLIYLFPRPILPYTLGMTLLVFFGVVAIIDLEHRVVLHPVSLFGVVFGLGVGIYLRSGKSLGEGILTTLIGGLAGFCIMLLLYLLGVFYVRLMAKKKGLPPDEIALGFGDVNLAGILGLMLGTKAIVACLFIAILGGGFVSLVIILGMLAVKKFRAFTAIPYAPFLILAAIYLLFS
jgi:prepilin signal peptidase PulO-like enzyme (type II secretory pathway)